MCFKIIFILVMAEGGYDPRDETTETTPLIPDTGDDVDDNIDLSKYDIYGNPIDPEPGATSTPHQPGGPYHPDEMHSLPQEQSGMAYPPGEPAWKALTYLYPDASATDLEAFIDPVTKRLKVKMAGIGKTSYYLMTEDKATKTEKLNPKLTKEIKKALGESTLVLVSVLQQERDRNLREIVQKRNKLNQMQDAASEVQERRQDLVNLRNRIRQLDDEIRELEDKAGSWDEEAIQKLKDEKRALEAEHQRKKAQLDQAIADAKKTELQLQVEINDLKLANRDIERQINKRGIKVAKQREELEQEKASLEERLAKNKRVLENENASPSEREAAQKEVEQDERALERVNEDVERE